MISSNTQNSCYSVYFVAILNAFFHTFVEHSYFMWTDESPVTFLDKTTSDGTADDLNIQYGYLEYRHHWKLGGESHQLGYICKGKPGNKLAIFEPPHGKTNNLHRRKQRRRSASR